MTEIKQLLTTFERFAYGQSLHTAFTELLDWTLLPFKKFDTSDEQLNAFEAFRNHKKVDQLTTLITLIGDLSEGFSDPIGRTIYASHIQWSQWTILHTNASMRDDVSNVSW